VLENHFGVEAGQLRLVSDFSGQMPAPRRLSVSVRRLRLAGGGASDFARRMRSGVSHAVAQNERLRRVGLGATEADTERLAALRALQIPAPVDEPREAFLRRAQEYDGLSARLHSEGFRIDVTQKLWITYSPSAVPLVLEAFDYGLLRGERSVWVIEHDRLLGRTDMVGANHLMIAVAVFTRLLNAPADRKAQYIDMLNRVALWPSCRQCQSRMNRTRKTSKKRGASERYCLISTADRAIVDKWRPFVEAGL
jgi:hypothetical protein